MLNEGLVHLLISSVPEFNQWRVEHPDDPVELRAANLRGRQLCGVDLHEVKGAGAILSGADLTGANLAGADLTGACFGSAILSDTDLTSAEVTIDQVVHAFPRISGLNEDQIDELVLEAMESLIPGGNPTGFHRSIPVIRGFDRVEAMRLVGKFREILKRESGGVHLC